MENKKEYTEQQIFTFDSQMAAMARVLHDWRVAHGFSLYAIAKYEDNEHPRTELFKKVEEGRGNMSSLLHYFDFIGWKDRKFLNEVLTRWRQQMGFE